MTCNGIRCSRCYSCNVKDSDIDCDESGMFPVQECYDCGNIMPPKKGQKLLTIKGG